MVGDLSISLGELGPVNEVGLLRQSVDIYDNVFLFSFRREEPQWNMTDELRCCCLLHMITREILYYCLKECGILFNLFFFFFLLNLFESFQVQFLNLLILNVHSQKKKNLKTDSFHKDILIYLGIFMCKVNSIY